MLEIITFIAGPALIIFMLYVTAFAAGAAALHLGTLLAGLACIGWMPILACALFEHYEIGGNTFTGRLALWSMWLYLALSAVILIIGFTVEDPDKIPPGYKFLALFYRHPVEGIRYANAPMAYVAAAAKRSENPAWARVQARKLRKRASDAEAEGEHYSAAAEALRAEHDAARAKSLKDAEEERLRNVKR